MATNLNVGHEDLVRQAWSMFHGIPNAYQSLLVLGYAYWKCPDNLTVPYNTTYPQYNQDDALAQKYRLQTVSNRLQWFLYRFRLVFPDSQTETEWLEPYSLLSETTRGSRNRSASNGRSTRSDSIREGIPNLDVALELATAGLEQQGPQTHLDAYKYPILTLPTEITSEIFVHFLPHYPERPPLIGLSSPHILGQICRTWREIAFSTPRLWRAIELKFPTTSPTMALDLLRTWLSRSKNCPLSISLQSRLLEVDFIQAIIPHSERWEYIELKLPIESLRLSGGDFPLLYSLTLGPTTYAEEVDSLDAISPFSNAPRLNQVALCNTFGPSEIQLPWSQLTSISVEFLTSTECTEILQHSAALREFRCDHVEVAAGNILPVAPLRYLHSLKLGGSMGHQMLREALTTPALRHLTISDSLDDAVPNINALILRSHCTLASLRILYTRHADMTYRAAFPSIPTITVTRGGLSPSCFARLPSVEITLVPHIAVYI
jgi:hypothetical protein